MEYDDWQARLNEAERRIKLLEAGQLTIDQALEEQALEVDVAGQTVDASGAS